MTKYEIIEKLYKERTVAKFIRNTAKTSNEDLNDLEQDIYEILLKQDDDKIVQLYEDEELEYWVARIICNQVKSQTSPFYSKYRKWSDKRSELRGEPRINDGDKESDYRWIEQTQSENVQSY